jgi:phosphoglycolate phosphatase-like HAD superfamily hydrolase
VLWDIDHTLIETRGVGGEIYADAFRKVTGVSLKRTPELAGRTEPVIFREALRLNDVPDEKGLYERFAAEQAQGYVDRAAELRRRGRALPGAEAALRALATRPGVVQSVLTGNTRPSAEAKVGVFGLTRHLNLDVGAYGTDDEDRATLVAVARDRAGKAFGMNFAGTSTVLVGDTQNDVRAALLARARIIAVATGKDSGADLASAGAATVFQDLTDTAAVAQAITGISAVNQD